MQSREDIPFADTRRTTFYCQQDIAVRKCHKVSSLDNNFLFMVHLFSFCIMGFKRTTHKVVWMWAVTVGTRRRIRRLSSCYGLNKYHITCYQKMLADCWILCLQRTSLSVLPISHLSSSHNNFLYAEASGFDTDEILTHRMAGVLFYGDAISILASK